MFRKLAIGLATIALATLASSSAFATKDGYVGLGAHFTWDNYKTPIVSTDAVNTGDDATLLSSSSYGSPNFGGQVDFGVTRQFSISLALDFGFFSHKVYPYPGNVASSGVSATNTNFWQIGPMISVKYLFRDPQPGKVSLFLSGGFGKYFAGSKVKGGAAKYRSAIKSAFYDQESCNIAESCDGDEKLEGDELDSAWDDYKNDSDAYEQAGAYDKAVDKELEAIGKLASPWVFQIAVGAEFFATDTFSLGADVLGLRFSFASSDVGKVDGISSDDPAAAWSGKQSYVNFYIYSALNLSFNLTGGGSKPAVSQPAADGSWDAAPSKPSEAGPATKQGQGDGWGADGWGSNWSTGPAAPATTATPAAPPPPPPPAPTPAPAKSAPASSGGSAPPPPPPPGY